MATTRPNCNDSSDTQDPRKEQSSRIVKFGFVGFGVGFFLTLVGVMAMETGGYGTPFFFFVFTAPSGLIAHWIVWLVSSIALWTMLGSFAGAANTRRGRAALLVLLLIHYISIPLVIAVRWQEIGGPTNFREGIGATGPLLIGGFVTYIAAQVFFCRLVLWGQSGADQILRKM